MVATFIWESLDVLQYLGSDSFVLPRNLPWGLSDNFYLSTRI
jgi:hypothetical protein